MIGLRKVGITLAEFSDVSGNAWTTGAGMQTDYNQEQRPEAMADVPGVCELSLTRAIVQYRDRQEVAIPGGRLQDIGLALVLDGRFAAAAEAIDLGSSATKVLDLSGELVVLDWVYGPTLEHMRQLATAVGRGESSAPRALQAYGLQLALRVLDRVGFSPLSRPTLLRLGFRDLCRDLDLHEETSVRFVMGPGSVTRAHLNYDGNLLVFRTLESGPVPELEEALVEAFPGTEVRRATDSDLGSGGRTLDATAYQVRFPLPLTMAEMLVEVDQIRSGFTTLLQRFEPERFNDIIRHVDALGRRSTLTRLRHQLPSDHLQSLVGQSSERSTQASVGSDGAHVVESAERIH